MSTGWLRVHFNNILLCRECTRELGEPVMNKAYQLLDKVDPELAEVSVC